jgi:hypothetical protein
MSASRPKEPLAPLLAAVYARTGPAGGGEALGGRERSTPPPGLSESTISPQTSENGAAQLCG